MHTPVDAHEPGVVKKMLLYLHTLLCILPFANFHPKNHQLPSNAQLSAVCWGTSTHDIPNNFKIRNMAKVYGLNDWAKKQYVTLEKFGYTPTSSSVLSLSSFAGAFIYFTNLTVVVPSIVKETSSISSRMI